MSADCSVKVVFSTKSIHVTASCQYLDLFRWLSRLTIPMTDDYETTPIPEVPRFQACNNATFTRPPLDGSKNLAQMYDWHGEHSPSHRLLLYPQEKDGSIRTIEWREGSQAVRRGAKVIRERVSQCRAITQRKVPLVAILSAAGQYIHNIRFSCFSLVIPTRRHGHFLHIICCRSTSRLHRFPHLSQKFCNSGGPSLE